MDISLLLTSAGPHCKPLECGVGGRVALLLKDGAGGKSADGSGVLIGEITAANLICSNSGSGQWSYTFAVDQSEVTFGESVVPENIANVCCLRCDTEAILAKLKRSEILAPMMESFRVFDDEEEVDAGQFRLFRFHSSIVLRAFEISVSRINTPEGYYPASPGTLTVKPLRTPEQVLGPWAEIGAAQAIIDPSSSTPLTARFEFTPPLILEGGRAFGISTTPENEDVFFGLEIHLEFSPIEE